MKTKKIPLAIQIALTILFIIPIRLKSYNIDQYLGLNQQTPAQFGAISLKSYFYSLYQTPHAIRSNINYINKTKKATFNNSFNKYIKGIYNKSFYTNFLSQDGSHIVEFLEMGNDLNLDIESVYSTLRLFYNKIKSCEIIDDTVALQILEPLPKLISKYFDEDAEIEPNFETLSKNIEQKLLFNFTEHLEEFETKPGAFISKVSLEIGEMAKSEVHSFESTIERKETLDRLRQIIIRLLETTLNKTMWNKVEYESIWNSVISIANKLHLLGVNGILDHMDDLDDLLWSLTHRFCFFLDVVGSSLPLSFYGEVENDLESKVIFFLETQEQDEGITSKKGIIWKALAKAKAKAIAFEKRGLFTDQLI